MKKTDPSSTRQTVLLGVLILLGIWALFHWMGGRTLVGPGTKEAIPEWSPHSLPPLVELGSTVPEEDPDSPPRNPFIFGPPPTPTPNLTPRPTPKPRPTRRPPGPRPTPTPTPKGWRRPPNFRMEYIGFFGPKERQVAVFRKQEDDGAAIEVATIGGIIEDTFILRSIDLESVVIGFVGFPEKEITRVPLETQ